jgi:arylsulfatase A-like enzyme/Flp pilus assembly protein TadD
MVVIRWFLLVAALTASALAAAPQTPVPNRKFPDIILITLDTTRADRMGFLGSPRGLTPNLDALAKQSGVFTGAYAQVPLTPPSHAAILTGTYPQFNKLNAMTTPLAADLPYAPQILRGHGYHTAAFVSAMALEGIETYGDGFRRGFETYDAGFHIGEPGEDFNHTVRRRGEETVAHALAWLDKKPKGPFFMWVHLYDAHDPYAPPEPYKSRYASAPYDGTIAYQDAVVGNLLRQLKLRGLYDSTILAITADHGESLGAHGEDTHGVFLYDETIHVPLLIKLAQASGNGSRITRRVELVDILPTLLEAAEFEIPKEVQGKSLLALMKPGGAGEKSRVSGSEGTAYSESDYGWTEYGWSPIRSLRASKYLYIQAPRRELYDQAADTKAEHNLAPSSSAVADTLASQLEAIRQKTSSNRKAVYVAPDAQAQQGLAALGYLASARLIPRDRAPDPDPKDKVQLANMIHRAQGLMQDRHFDEAIVLLQQVVAEEPQLWLYPMLGDWLIQNQQYEEAIPVLRKALEIVPDSKEARFRLAKSYMALKQYDAAIPELEKTVAAMPNFVRAHSYLEMAYARTNRLEEAIRECNTVLRYAPEDYESYMLLGYALPRTGDTQGAVEALKKAASLKPNVPLPHAWLADLYDQLGQKADAEREREEARRLQANAKPGAKAGPPSR